MFRNLFKRIALLLFMSGVILLTGFFLLRLLPGDSIRLKTSGNNDGRLTHSQTDQYRQLYYANGMHLPLFYISLSNQAVPDSFYNLPDENFRFALIRLSLETGNPESVYRLLKSDIHQSWKEKVNAKDISASKLSDFYGSNQTGSAWHSLSRNARIYSRYFPSISFNTDNQFHRWLTGDKYSRGILKGDFGISSYSGRTVSGELKKPFLVTLIMTVLSLIFSSIIAIVVAIWLSNSNSYLRNYIASPLFLFIYSVPVFVTGTLLLYVFANPDLLQWVPASGYEDDRSLSILPWFILPVICYSLATIVFVARLLIEGFDEESDLDYTRTALAKGAGISRVRIIHQLRNILITAMVVVIGSFPVLLNGSVLIENIFSVPGLGSLMMRAVQTRDVPLLTGFFLLTGFITILTYQFIDWLAVRLDPRIRIPSVTRN